MRRTITVKNGRRKNRSSKSSKSPNGKHPGGRPTLYKPEYCRQVYVYCSKHECTNKDLGELLGVTRTVIDRWRKEHKEFEASIKEGWYLLSSRQIERSLKKRAQGYEYDEVHTEFTLIDGKRFTEKKVKKGKKSMVIMVEGVKHKVVRKKIQPDITAMIFWLCNRQPELWESIQKQIIHASGSVDHNHHVDWGKMKRSEIEQINDILARAVSESGDGTDGGQVRTRLPFSPRLRQASMAIRRN